jgi:hypothetical protein
MQQVPSIVLVIIIIIADGIYKKIATEVTNLENHRTVPAYEYSLV